MIARMEPCQQLIPEQRNVSMVYKQKPVKIHEKFRLNLIQWAYTEGFLVRKLQACGMLHHAQSRFTQSRRAIHHLPMARIKELMCILVCNEKHV